MISTLENRRPSRNPTESQRIGDAIAAHAVFTVHAPRDLPGCKESGHRLAVESNNLCVRRNDESSHRRVNIEDDS